ncbi:hypothetical protein ABIA33_007144 [Streptacidiphilus sp. MAP12-16]|uniref:hypothetical protein n=1 Tax=Streptacidiphilus sp. MAP12-16 TaxID=3156300 RepID=UPI0035171517
MPPKEHSASRTVHHIPNTHAHDSTRVILSPSAPWQTVVLVDLRYSAACLAQAAREGRRPRPQRRRYSVLVYSYARYAARSRSVSREAAQDERRARQALRTRLDTVHRQLAVRGYGEEFARAAVDLDVVPARHRHNVVWQP